MKYRKKPVVIEAKKITAKNFYDVADWCKSSRFAREKGELCFDIDTLEGTMTAFIGDYIIKGVQGEFYPCKSDIFEATYDKA